MRRLWAAGAATMVCLALGGVPALAQEESPPASPSASPVPVAMAPAVFTGEDTGSSLVASDPRVSGTYSTTWDAQVEIPYGSAGAGQGGMVAWGNLTVNGPDGDWIGRWAVTAGYDFPTPSRIIALLEGTQAYEGWAAVAWVTTPEGWIPWMGGSQELEGVIYQGEAPEMALPGAVPPASE
jgi:hypothetical protein